MRGKNYLDFIPEKNYNWKLKCGSAVIIMPHRGFYARLAHYLFGTPLKSYISLDEIGTYIWLLINGRRSIGEIHELANKKFPLKNEGLEEYFAALQKNKFIRVVK